MLVLDESVFEEYKGTVGSDDLPNCIVTKESDWLAFKEITMPTDGYEPWLSIPKRKSKHSRARKLRHRKRK